MNPTLSRFLPLSCLGVLLTMALAVSPAPCRAGLILKVQDYQAPTAGTDGSFDIAITNDGPAVNLATYSVDVTAPSGLDFTGGSTPSNYVFPISESLGPQLADPNNTRLSFPATRFVASDIYYNPNDPSSLAYTIAKGTYNLVHVDFSLSAGTSSFPGVTFGPDTSFLSGTGGTISVSTVPEPSTLAMALVGCVALAAVRVRSLGRRRGRCS